MWVQWVCKHAQTCTRTHAQKVEEDVRKELVDKAKAAFKPRPCRHMIEGEARRAYLYSPLPRVTGEGVKPNGVDESLMRLLAACTPFKSISKHVFIIIYLIESISDCSVRN